jgi:hypothetical protein
MHRLVSSSFGIVVLILSLSTSAWAQHEHSCEPDATPRPILSVGDFDGDGFVTHADVSLVGDQVDSGEYVAFYDLDADGDLDGQDVSAAARAMAQGKASTVLDRQLAELFWATEMYRDKNAALAAGFRPFTQPLMGHGQHYARMPFWVTPTGLDPSYLS